MNFMNGHLKKIVFGTDYYTLIIKVLKIIH